MTPGISSDYKSNSLIDTMSLCNLVQLNSVHNANNSFLELVCLLQRKWSYYLLNLIDFYHPPLKIVLIENIKLKKIKRMQQLRYNYRQLPNMKKDLANVNWSRLLDEPDVNAAVDVLPFNE